MKKQLLAIRWAWYTPKREWNSGLNTWMSPAELMREERDAEWERSCEVEYRDGLWWACPDSFGLVLDPQYPIRKVWASDVHTYWAEATFPAKPPVVAFARPQGAGKNWKVMYRAAVKAFGNLPIIDVAVHPDAQTV